MIEWQRTLELREEVGAEVFSEIFDIFLEESKSTLEQLSLEDQATLKAQIHFMKGSSLHVGFRGLAELCEQYLLHWESHVPQDMISALRSHFEASTKEFYEKLSSKIDELTPQTVP